MSTTGENNDIAALAAIRDFKGKYPKQLWFLFLAEMWERFCFYGMRGVLTVFMMEQLLMPEKEANLKYGAIQAFVYTMTFVGGFFADKILGFRKSIFWGGLLMIIGSFTIAMAPTELFYIGTSISIVGTGFFKPNISGVVGLLYNDGDKRRDAGFALFYSGINIGALLGGYLCFNLGDNYGWHWAFIVAGIAMMLGLIVFALTQKTLGPLGFSPLLKKDLSNNSRVQMTQVFVYIGSLLAIPFILLLVQNTAYTDMFMYIVGPCALIYLVYEMSSCTKQEISKLMAALIFIIFSMFFWAFFEQSGGSLAIVARNHVDSQILGMSSIFGLKLNPNEVNNMANSLFVILLSPLFGLLWIWLNGRKAEPNTVVKFGLGFIFLAAAFYVFHLLIGFSSPEGISSLTVFAFAYLIITIGELCLSPIGLSAMTKLAPKRLFGIIMGLWFLASAYGQYLAGILGAGMSGTGEFRTEIVASANTEDNNGNHVFTWADTSKVPAKFERMNISLTAFIPDSLELEWKPGKSKGSLVQATEQGDTLNWKFENTPNDGSEIFALPASLVKKAATWKSATAIIDKAGEVHVPLKLLNDAKAEFAVEPVSYEKLMSYTNGYSRLGLYGLICGIALIVISPLVRKLMLEVK